MDATRSRTNAAGIPRMPCKARTLSGQGYCHLTLVLRDDPNLPPIPRIGLNALRRLGGILRILAISMSRTTPQTRTNMVRILGAIVLLQMVLLFVYVVPRHWHGLGASGEPPPRTVFSEAGYSLVPPQGWIGEGMNDFEPCEVGTGPLGRVIFVPDSVWHGRHGDQFVCSRVPDEPPKQALGGRTGLRDGNYVAYDPVKNSMTQEGFRYSVFSRVVNCGDRWFGFTYRHHGSFLREEGPLERLGLPESVLRSIQSFRAECDHAVSEPNENIESPPDRSESGEENGD